MVHIGCSLFATEEMRLAILPLLESGEVDAIEWTLDHGWSQDLPAWVTALLDAYGEAGRLYGHGLRLSPTSRFDDASRAWLARAAGERWRYRHLTEHWGYSRARGLVRGAPMPLPASEAVIECTVRALRELADVAGVPVGLENLALALGPGDVDAQPVMLARVLDAIDGVLLLDVHNLWCQAQNFARDPRELATRYPLARVRQLHVAGGGWSESAYGEPFRRDTHDALAPADVIDLVAWLVPRCPALELVILERLPQGLADEPARAAWRDEFRALARVVRAAGGEPLVAIEPPRADVALASHSIDELARFQDVVTAALLAGGDARAVHAAVLAGAGPFCDEVAGWDLRAIEVAITLAGKWGVPG